MTQAVRVAAPAKVNLVLRILDRRPDGYHNLWSLMQTVGLEDELTLRLSATPGVRLECSDPTLPTDGTNLVVRAAELVLGRTRPDVGLDIRLVKHIPAGGGLGGGSSDAAATIVGLNQLLDLGWTTQQMAEVGQTLGSDVPFFFFAPAAQVAGRGEAVTPVQIVGSRWIVLVNPGFPIETRWAYTRLAEVRGTVRPLPKELVSLAGRRRVEWETVIPLMENDFESALQQTHEVLIRIKGELLRAGAEAALVSGSGATVFGVFREETAASRAREAVGVAQGRWSAAVPIRAQPLSARSVPTAALREHHRLVG